MSNKLDVKQRVAIALSRQKSLREIANQYRVHHSTIDDIYKESEEILQQYWQQKSERKGRPAQQQDVQSEQLTQFELDKKQLTKQLALKQMRIDWLELQLEWEHKRALEENRKPNKQLKKKEKIDMIELVAAHSKSYSDITQAERLNCLDTTAASFLHLQRNIRDRLSRESAIPDRDIEQAVQQIIDYPFLGGVKGSLTLQQDEKALLGETVYKEIKQQLRLEAEKELSNRKQQSELEKNQYKRLHDKEEIYEKVVPQKKHEVWAIDFVTFLLFGIYFRICVVYEVFSQAYLAIKPADVATTKVAVEALISACEYSGEKPQICLLSDHGKQFICHDFEELLDRLQIEGQLIPPGQPWHNGSLESGNRDLKKVIYTIAFQQACKDIGISKIGVDRQRVFSGLEDYCATTQQLINEQIVRPKFKTTPMTVLTDKVAEKMNKRTTFITNKLKERKQRMEQLKKQGGSKRKRIEDKATTAWKKISARMSTDEVFAFCELINERYRAVAV